jgi:four helix bundle protein
MKEELRSPELGQWPAAGFHLSNSAFTLLTWLTSGNAGRAFCGYLHRIHMKKPENDLRNRTLRFALRIVRMFGSLPKTAPALVIGKQVLRSGTSVGANYREAYRGRSKAEFIAKCGDSLRELEETAYWLELLVEGELVTAAKLAPLRQECDELTAIFVTIVKRSRVG